MSFFFLFLNEDMVKSSVCILYLEVAELHLVFWSAVNCVSAILLSQCCALKVKGIVLRL